MNKYYVCLDIGGMSIKHGVLTEEGALLTSGAFPLSTQISGVKSLLNALKTIIAQYQTEYSLSGVSIATAGVVDPLTGIILAGGAHFPGYTGTNLVSFMKEECNLACTVENDVNALALGVCAQKDKQSHKLVYVLAMGTGIGGALLVEGRLISGASFSTGEIGLGHMSEKINWEDVASTGVLVQKVAQAKNLPLSKVTGSDVFSWAGQGDKVAQECIDEMLERWSEGILNICYMLNPEEIIIGGAISAQAAYLKPLLLAKLEAKLLPLVFKATTISFVETNVETVLQGALSNFLQKNVKK